MKHLILIVLIFCSGIISGQQLFVKTTNGYEELKAFCNNTAIIVHYYNDLFIVYSSIKAADNESKLLDRLEKNDKEYYVVYYADLPENIDNTSYKTLFTYGKYAIISTFINQLPINRKSIYRINLESKVKLPDSKAFAEVKTANPAIAAMVAIANADTVWNHIQHLQNYGTRLCSSPQAFQAQNWLFQQYQSLGLLVSLQDFEFSPNSSDNVIAIQYGQVNPQRYIIIGGHYDSYVFSGNSAPGADDNASGTAGVLEVARVLSQYAFNYSIIYCAFSAEEYGLYGSDAYVNYIVNQNYDVIGYLNLDMIGYLHPGSNIHTDIIAPVPAKPLSDYYKQIVATYVPDFQATDGNLSGGDSDHTSFNMAGIMGIFPFEDDQNYSPYIHSSADLLGTSVNSKIQLKKFVQASIAFTASLAEPFNGYYPPSSLSLQYNNNSIILKWKKPLNHNFFRYYRIYRNNFVYDTIMNVNDTVYCDYAIADGINYQYYITSVYLNDTMAESIPATPVSFTPGSKTIYAYNFEHGLQGWQIEGNLNGWQINHPVALQGNNTTYLSIDSDAAGPSQHVTGYAISPSFNLLGETNISIIFDYGYRNYYSDLFNLLYRTNTTSSWNVLSALPPSLIFIPKTIDFAAEITSDKIQFAFFYDDNNTFAWYAAFDNFKIQSVKQPSALPAPCSLTATNNVEGINLYWTFNEKNLLPQMFRIYRNGILYDSVSYPASNYSDTHIPANGLYCYFVTACYTTGSSNPSNQARAYFNTSTTNNNRLFQVSIWPNPAKEKVYVTSEFSNIKKAAIYSTEGKIIMKHSINCHFVVLDIDKLPSGLYFLRIETEKGVTLSKIVKE